MPAPGDVPRKIAIFDYSILPINPVGSCHLRILQGLCQEHEFTVFAVEFENPCPERIRFVRIPAPTRPLALLFLAYHVLAPLYYLAYCLRHRARFDLVQTVESNLSFADVAYAHFCHRAYLRHHFGHIRAAGLPQAARWLDHWLHARLEPRVYRTSKRVVVPSRGLVRELSLEYPAVLEKIEVIPNPVDLARMRRPPGFDRDAFRSGLGLFADDVVLVFVALGHFERKGLPVLLEAMPGTADRRVKLVVVGGTGDAIAAYRARADAAGLGGRVVLVGRQRDVRPYLWAADAFVLPSSYEVFPLSALEAAAAGLPLIVTPLNGIEEFVRDGENGLLVGRDAGEVRLGLDRFRALPADARRSMGDGARKDVERYATESFVGAWRALYGEPCRA